jgi:DNA-binding NarL/FixJ family response regulator
VTTVDPIRVMVVDDSPTTREMLREALGMIGGIEVVGEANDGEVAVSTAARVQPDVVLMDVRMPGVDGVSAARTMTARSPDTRIVALTMMDDPGTVRSMIAAGAIGYVVKGGTIDELAAAIKQVSHGEPELDHKVVPGAVEDLRRLLEEEVVRREEIERLGRIRDEFVQVLSHELRTPLTVIVGALKMLGARVLTDDEQFVVDSALRRTDQLEFLVQGLELAASAPSETDLTLPDQAVAAAADRLEMDPQIQSADPGEWSGVPQAYVYRVAYELLANADRHGRPPIGVRIFREGAEGVLEVCDHGGWSAHDEDLGPFSQGDMSGTRAASGFGLGLFLSSRLCSACGGRLSVRSDAGLTLAEARFRLADGQAD